MQSLRVKIGFNYAGHTHRKANHKIQAALEKHQAVRIYVLGKGMWNRESPGTTGTNYMYVSHGLHLLLQSDPTGQHGKMEIDSGPHPRG